MSNCYWTFLLFVSRDHYIYAYIHSALQCRHVKHVSKITQENPQRKQYIIISFLILSYITTKIGVSSYWSTYRYKMTYTWTILHINIDSRIFHIHDNPKIKDNSLLAFSCRQLFSGFNIICYICCPVQPIRYSSCSSVHWLLQDVKVKKYFGTGSIIQECCGLTDGIFYNW